MLIIGCVLTMRQGLIQANIALPMQTFLDSKQIAFQKNISNIKQKTDISFQFFCQLILTCQIKLCLVHVLSLFALNLIHFQNEYCALLKRIL